MRIPSLFVSHGAPTLALEPGTAGALLTGLGRSLPRPRAILAISAHWDTPQPNVSNAPQPRTLHDFGGFPEPLYSLQYPAPGAPPLAERVRSLLLDAGFDTRLDPYRGLDHGAWVPLRFLYPEADIPVTQLSIQGNLDAGHHYRMGQALSSLLEDGVLLLASGSVTHNLGDLGPLDAAPEGYAMAFADWLWERLAGGRVTELLDYRRLAPHAQRAHPGEDHLLPLFVALGAAGQESLQRHAAGTTHGALVMDIYQFG